MFKSKYKKQLSVFFITCFAIFAIPEVFKFLYEKEQFSALNALTGSHNWKVTLPDNSTCSFGGTSSVKLDGVGVNAALTYTLAVKPNSEMIWA